MGVLNLMKHGSSGTVILHPGPLFQQGAVVHRVCGIIAGSDSDPHGCVDHRVGFLELDAVFLDVVVVGVDVMPLLVHIVVGQNGLIVYGSAAMSVILYSDITSLRIQVGHEISVSLHALLEIECGITLYIPIYVWIHGRKRYLSR